MFLGCLGAHTMTAPAKPAKGTAAREKRARRATIERQEGKAKILAKVRDNYTCRRCQRGPTSIGMEAAHVDDKGMGGDHGLRSSQPSDYVTLCRSCHQGPRSVHSRHVVIECGPERGDGPVVFREADPRSVGRFVVAMGY
jgi:hypothetical protein